MTVKLISLLATGPDKVDAVVDFRSPATLIRGPSDTGKSYIRDCLWYLLGGDKTPKKVPEDDGYELLELEFSDDNDNYVVRRALRGGGAQIFRTKQAADRVNEAPANGRSSEGKQIVMD